MCVNLTTLLDVSEVIDHSMAIFLHMGQRVLVTFLQRFYRVSVIIGNNLTNTPQGINNFCKPEILATELPIPSDLLPEGCDYPLEQLADVIV